MKIFNLFGFHPTKSRTILIFLSICFSLLLLSKKAQAGLVSNTETPYLQIKGGVDIGIPYGLPGFHMEIGHPNLAAIFGFGNIRGVVIEGKKLPFGLFIGASGTIFPYGSKFRPKLTVLFTTVSEYILHQGQTSDGEWTVFYEENFPGLCALLDFEITLTEYFYIELGAGINKPFKGWEAIDELWENKGNKRSSPWVNYVQYYSGRNDIRFSVHLGFSFQFWSKSK